MDKKRLFLEKLIQKQIPTLCEEIQTQEVKTGTICAEITNNLRQLQNHGSRHTTNESSDFICEMPIGRLCGLESRYTLALGDYAHQTLSTPRVASMKATLDTSSQSIVHGDSICDCSTTGEQSHYVELARLSNCKRSTLDLETRVGACEASLRSQINRLNDRLNDLKMTGTPSEFDYSLDPLEDCKENIGVWQRQCDQLATQLAHLDEAEVRQAEMERSLAREQAYWQHVDKIFECISEENAWLRFLTDLVQAESESCERATELLQRLQSMVDSFVHESHTLIRRLSLAHQTEIDRERDRFVRALAAEKFTVSLTETLKTCPLPADLQELRDSEPISVNSVATMIKELRNRLAQTTLSTRQLSEKIAECAPQIHRQLTALEQTFHVPDNTHPVQSTPSHVDCIEPSRLIASAVGLCAPDLVDSLSSAASELASLKHELRRVQHESDVVFALQNL